jgi:DNA anti-recombination protein RmuC
VATDVTELITRLDHYKAALNQGAQRLRSDMKEMERRKATLKSELDGNFARSFYRSWEQSERVFNDYMTGSEQLIRLFDERIAALRRFDTSEG